MLDLAKAGAGYLIACAQADKAYELGIVNSVPGTGQTYIDALAGAKLTLTDLQADADLAWIDLKAQADETFLTADATAWQTMSNGEAATTDQYALDDDTSTQAENDAVALDESNVLTAEATADQTQGNSDAAADADFQIAQANETSTVWQDIVGWASPTGGPDLAGLPWIQTQAGLAGAEATWAVTAAGNYQTYVSQLGIAEVNYADTNASDFLNEIKSIDLADKTAADGAANADEQLSTTLTNDEVAFEDVLDPASQGFQENVGQAQHDYRQAIALADYNLAIGGTQGDYGIAVAAAQSARQAAYNTAYSTFATPVMPAISQQGTDDAAAELLDTQTVDGEGLTDIQDNNAAVSGYQDQEAALYAGEQDAQAQALDVYQVANAVGHAAAIGAYAATAGGNPWADLAAAQAIADASSQIAQATALEARSVSEAQTQETLEQAQNDATASKDDANAQAEEAQSESDAESQASAQTSAAAVADQVFVDLPDTLIAPADGPALSLTPDFRWGYEANDYYLGETWTSFGYALNVNGPIEPAGTPPDFLPADLEPNQLVSGPYGGEAQALGTLWLFDYGAAIGDVMPWDLEGCSTPVSLSDLPAPVAELTGVVISGIAVTSAYGQPIEFVAQTLRELDPLVQDYQTAMRMSDAANGLISVSNTACATGIGGYSQSQVPTTLTAQDLAATGAPTQNPATALEAPSPSPTTMDPPGEQEPPPEPQLENGVTNPSTTTAADTSTQDAAAGGVTVIVWAFGPDPNKEPADVEDRSAGESEKSTGDFQLKLAGPEQGAQQTYSLLVGPPQNAAEAAAQAANTATEAGSGGQGTSPNSSTQNGQATDQSSPGSVVIIVIASQQPRSQLPPIGGDPNSPLYFPVNPDVAAEHWLMNLNSSLLTLWGEASPNEPTARPRAPDPPPTTAQEKFFGRAYLDALKTEETAKDERFLEQAWNATHGEHPEFGGGRRLNLNDNSQFIEGFFYGAGTASVKLVAGGIVIGVVSVVATPAMGMAVGGILLTGSTGIASYSRLQDGQGLLKSGVGGVADVLGVSGVVAGGWGVDVMTWKGLGYNDFQRGNALGGGLVQVGAWSLAAPAGMRWVASRRAQKINVGTTQVVLNTAETTELLSRDWGTWDDPAGTDLAALPKYFRREGSGELVELIVQSGVLRGEPARNIFRSDIPSVKAYEGSLKAGEIGFEFYTLEKPIGPMDGLGGRQWRWYGTPGEETYEIVIFVTKIQK